MPLVVCFAGQIGSGKSSVTRTLAEALGWQRAGFGDYLRTELERRGGDVTSRDALQDLGQSLVDKNAEGFSRVVLALADFQPGTDLLVDGIRHIEIYRSIQRLVAPSQAKLVYLAADNATRLKRVTERAGDRTNLEQAEKHPAESELKWSLPSVADSVIDATAPLELVLKDTLDAFARWGADPQVVARARVVISLTRGSSQ